MKVTTKFRDNTDEIPKIMAASIHEAVEKSAQLMQRNIKVHTPVVSGTLHRSILTRITGAGKAEVYSAEHVDNKTVDYAVYVEYGTRYFPPRAMFRKGVSDSEADIMRLFKEALRKVELARLRKSIKS